MHHALRVTTQPAGLVQEHDFETAERSHRFTTCSATPRHFSREAGVDHHLAKPVSFDVLEKILKAVPEKLA